MVSQFLAYYVSKEEYQNHLRSRVPFSPNYKPYLQIAIHKEFDMYSFYCRFYQIRNGAAQILQGNDLRGNSHLNEFYEKRKEFYITANGVTFYKVLEVRNDTNDFLEIGMKMVVDQTYVEKDHFFMVMPFNSAALNDFYENHIRSFLLDRLKVSIFRSDNFTDTDVIIDTVIKEIERSEFVICDITHCNKNVFFEIGYAKAIGKQLIFLIEKNRQHSFFDIAHVRHIEYEIEQPKAMQERLIDTINVIRNKV